MFTARVLPKAVRAFARFLTANFTDRTDEERGDQSFRSSRPSCSKGQEALRTSEPLRDGATKDGRDHTDNAGGHGATKALSLGKAETTFVGRHMRCSRGCPPAAGGFPRRVGDSSHPNFLTLSRFSSSLPARPSLDGTSVAAAARWVRNSLRPSRTRNRPRLQPRLHGRRFVQKSRDGFCQETHAV